MEVNERKLREVIKFFRKMEQREASEKESKTDMSIEKAMCAGSEIAFGVAANYLEEIFELKKGGM